MENVLPAEPIEHCGTTGMQCPAFHEAGHAVVALEMGLGVRSVDIIARERVLGVCRHSAPGRRWSEELECGTYDRMPAWARRRLEAEVMVCWAGFLAEQLHLGVPTALLAALNPGFGLQGLMEAPESMKTVGVAQVADVDRGSDLDQLTRLTELVFPEDDERLAYQEWLRLRTRNLLRQSRTWPTVEAVAEALRTQRKLSGKELRAVWQTARRRAIFGPQAPDL